MKLSNPNLIVVPQGEWTFFSIKKSKVFLIERTKFLKIQKYYYLLTWNVYSDLTYPVKSSEPGSGPEPGKKKLRTWARCALVTTIILEPLESLGIMESDASFWKILQYFSSSFKHRTLVYCSNGVIKSRELRVHVFRSRIWIFLTSIWHFLCSRLKKGSRF
jgi:hypothetical protein